MTTCRASHNSIPVLCSFLWVPVFLALRMPLLAADEISVESKVDRQEITIGDRVMFTLTILADTALAVDSLMAGVNLGAFEIKDYKPRTITRRGGHQTIVEEYEITTFTTGDYQIPALTINYRAKTGEQRSITSDPLPIRVKSLLTGEEGEDIKPLKPQKSFEREFPLWEVIIAGGLLAAIITFIILYRRAKRPIDLTTAEIDSRLPWEIALDELGKLRDSDFLAKGEYKQYYLRLSDIFRRYLEKRYGISALERTTTEIVTEFRSLALDPAEESQIGRFLDDCDLVKFAKHHPTHDEIENDFSRAQEFVLQTRSLPHSSMRTT